jgi:hypothetical protein
MSAKAFAGQESYRLIIKTGIDFALHPPTNAQILYRAFKETSKKDRFQSWEASIWPVDKDGRIFYDFSVAVPVPMAATYEIRARLTIDGKKVPTAIAKWVVEE